MWVRGQRPTLVSIGARSRRRQEGGRIVTPKPTGHPDTEAHLRTETHSPVTVAADPRDTDRPHKPDPVRRTFHQCASGDESALAADIGHGLERGHDSHRRELEAWRESGLTTEAGS
jgi:hypothetical protein